MSYEIVMGLEVHVELATESKLFCRCSSKFGAGVNENVCPACCGMPGMPAVLNRKAVELAISAGILTNCEISKSMAFDKKSYFYPDLPAGYQITQYFAPVCTNGSVAIQTSDGEKVITIKQIHIEEDAGKLVHDSAAGATLIDFNRASVPLIEIVSNPDFRSAEEVTAYLEKLRSLLSFAGISDCKMQQGSLRCDVNISVRKPGDEKLGIRTEIKNMNSLKAVCAAIDYESSRHIDALETGSETLVQQTRGWDDGKGVTFAMRDKEDATDYRYFPNPELPAVSVTDEWIERIRGSIPESAQAKYRRLTDNLGMSEYDAAIITSSKNLSDIFDAINGIIDSPKEAANWIIVELLGAAKKEPGDEDINIDCVKFARIIELVINKTINRNIGKKLLATLFEEDIDPDEYIEQNKLGMVSDAAAIGAAVSEVLAANQKSIDEFVGGNQKVYGFLMGQIMRKLAGKADPKLVGEILAKRLTEVTRR